MKSVAERYTTFETAAGMCAIAWNEHGILRFQLPTGTPADVETWRTRRVPDATFDSPSTEVSKVIDGAVRYFSGHPVDFSDAALDLRHQPAFFCEIYGALRRVPYGTTTTYGELAKIVGASVERSREVGVAMATNPIPLIIPCHRVLAAGGRLGGFSAPGGTRSKLHMLQLEGITVAPHKASKIVPEAQGTFAF